MYSNEVGLTAVCVSCEQGKYRQSKESNGEGGFTEKNTDSTICVDCPAGWSSLKGSTKCQSCEAGKYGDVVSEDCQSCDVGQYRTSEMLEATKCRLCEPGLYQNGEGQASCLPCIPGEYQRSACIHIFLLSRFFSYFV